MTKNDGLMTTDDEPILKFIEDENVQDLVRRELNKRATELAQKKQELEEKTGAKGKTGRERRLN